MLSKLRELFGQGRCREDLRQLIWFGVGYAVVLVLGYLLMRQINLSLSVEEMGRFSYTMSLVGAIAAVFYQAPALAYLRFHDNHAVSPELRRRLLPIFVFATVAAGVVLWWRTHSLFALAFAFIAPFFERMYVCRAQMRVGAVNFLKIAEMAVPFLALLLLSAPPSSLPAPLSSLLSALSSPSSLSAPSCSLLSALSSPSSLSPLPSSLSPSPSSFVLGLYGLGYATCFFFPLRLKKCEAPSGGVLARFLVPILLPTLVAVLIENLTVIATKAYLGYEAAAQMGVAARNLIFIKALFQFFQMFYPVIYFREMKLGRFGIVRLYRAIIVVSAVGFVALMTLFAPLLYSLTGAKAYVGTSGVFVVLAVATLLDFLFDVFALYFQYEIKTWKTTLVKTVFLIVLASGVLLVSNPSLTTLVGVVLAASLASSLPGLFWAYSQERQHMKGFRSHG